MGYESRLDENTTTARGGTQGAGTYRSEQNRLDQRRGKNTDYNTGLWKRNKKRYPGTRYVGSWPGKRHDDITSEQTAISSCVETYLFSNSFDSRPLIASRISVQ